MSLQSLTFSISKSVWHDDEDVEVDDIDDIDRYNGDDLGDD